MKELIDRKISGIRINPESDVLAFDHPDGSTTSFNAAAGCCSTSWFADIVGVSMLIGGTVRAVEEVGTQGLSGPDWRRYQCAMHKVHKTYAYKLTTNLGYVDIVFRNDSNGWYGGEPELREEPLPEDMKNVTEDK